MKELDYGATFIVTPEHVRLELNTAGLGSRAAAMLLDLLLISACLGGFTLLIGIGLSVTGGGFGDLAGDYAAAFLILLYSLLVGAYFALMEYYMAGQTWGKRLIGLRAIQENGQPLTFLSSVIRNFLRIIDFLPSFYLLGAVWMFVHPSDKRLGDLAAGTIVVHDRRDNKARARARLEKWLRKRAVPTYLNIHLEPSTLRGAITREDWVLVENYVERMPTLNRYKRYELAWHLAARLGGKLQIVENAQLRDPESFMIQLYYQLYEEWAL